MKSFACATLLFAACTGGERADTGQCPAGETCSSKTRYGLHFIGAGLADELNLGGPLPTAVGGTQNIDLQYDLHGYGVLMPLDLPYTADDDGGAGIAVVSHNAATVTIRGAGAAANYLRILDASDGTLFDRMMLNGAEVQTVSLVPAELQAVPANAPLAWAAGAQRSFGVALNGTVPSSSGPVATRLIDESMQLALSGISNSVIAWDTVYVSVATAGTYPLSVTAGDRGATELAFVVTDHADSIDATGAPTTIPAGGTQQVCLAATFQGRFVLDFEWAWAVDGTSMTTHGSPCYIVQTTKTSGSVAVQATAGGQSVTLSLAVGAMTHAAPSAATPERPSAGERAATFE
jgi:hypothetical protein